MFKKLVFSLITAMLLAVPALAQQKTLKIGYVTILSGPLSGFGADMRDAFELALDHKNRMLGGLKTEVIYADEQMKPEVGKQMTEKLIESDKVDFLSGYPFSNVLLASLPPAINAKTFFISNNAGPSEIAGAQCSPWFFSTSWEGAQRSVAMGRLLNSRGVKKLYILAPNYTAGKDKANGVKVTYKGEIVGEEYTRWPGQLDFSVELTKIRAANPDAVWAFYPGNFGVQFLNQYAQAGLQGKIPLYSDDTVDANNLPTIGDKALGVLSAQAWVEDLKFPTNEKFVADFTKKYGRTPTHYAQQAYDGALLIDSAVRAVKGNLADKDALRAALRKADFESTRGHLKYGNNHFLIENIYASEVVKKPDGRVGFRTLGIVSPNDQDLEHGKCPMKW